MTSRHGTSHVLLHKKQPTVQKYHDLNMKIVLLHTRASNKNLKSTHLWHSGSIFCSNFVRPHKTKHIHICVPFASVQISQTLIQTVHKRMQQGRHHYTATLPLTGGLLHSVQQKWDWAVECTKCSQPANQEPVYLSTTHHALHNSDEESNYTTMCL